MSEVIRSHTLISSCPDPPGQTTPWTTSPASAARIPTVRSTASATPATSRSAVATASTSSFVNSTPTPAALASPSARARPCTAAASPMRRPSPSSTTWPRATAFDKPDASSASNPIPSSDWPAPPDSTPTTLTTSSWLFPPQTREVQFDEKWSFVAKKQKNCDPTDPADDQKGDWWDHVAYDPEHKLVLAVVPGARVTESVEEVVAEVKEREKDRVVAIHRNVVLGSQQAADQALKASVCSRTINTSFVERQHATDRGQNARKARRTYRFSKDWRVHEAMTYFTLYRYNFCWVVRTLRIKDEDGRGQRRTPAMAAGLERFRLGCSISTEAEPFLDVITRHRP